MDTDPGSTDANAEAPVLWPSDANNIRTGKVSDAGKDWGQEEKGVTADGMVGWHHRLDGHGFEQTLEDSEGQGSLACCSPWGHKVRHDWLNKTRGICPHSLTEMSTQRKMFIEVPLLLWVTGRTPFYLWGEPQSSKSLWLMKCEQNNQCHLLKTFSGRMHNVPCFLSLPWPLWKYVSWKSIVILGFWMTTMKKPPA